MSEDASLRDASVTPEVTPTVDPVTPPVAAPPDSATLEATEVGRLILDSGYTREQLNDLMESPKALQALKYQLQNDPAEFIRSLERTNPEVGAKLLDASTDLFLARHGKEATTSKPDKGDTSNELMAEIKALREKTAQLESKEAQRENAIAMAAAQKRYDSHIDNLLSQSDVKELNLTKAESKGLRARLSAELASDPQIVRRISSGNFVDIPRVFKGIAEEWGDDKKSAAKAEQDRRDGVTNGAFPGVEAGPSWQNFKPEAAAADSWDATETGLAKALERFSR